MSPDTNHCLIDNHLTRRTPLTIPSRRQKTKRGAVRTNDDIRVMFILHGWWSGGHGACEDQGSIHDQGRRTWGHVFMRTLIPGSSPRGWLQCLGTAPLSPVAVPPGSCQRIYQCFKKSNDNIIWFKESRWRCFEKKVQNVLLPFYHNNLFFNYKSHNLNICNVSLQLKIILLKNILYIKVYFWSTD